MSIKKYRIWAQIDLAALRENFKIIQKTLDHAMLMPVIKANAYGLGAVQVSLSLKDAGAEYAAVSCLSEAWDVLQAGLSVILLGATLPEDIDAVVVSGAIPAIQSIEEAKAFNKVAQRMNKPTKVHLKIDTGMGRFGIPIEDAYEEIKQINKLNFLELDGIFSHLARSRMRDKETIFQIESLTNLVQKLAESGIKFNYCHIANSTAIAGLEETTKPPFNMVRSGIDIYGGHLSLLERSYHINPVFTLKARLLSIKNIKKGHSVSYGRTYRVKEKGGENVGVISIGYADGYPRSLSNCGQMIVGGMRCNIIGLVCMDYTMISLKNAPNAKVGDEVVLIGRQNNEEITISDLAKDAHTIPYELMCGLGTRVERDYVNAT